MKRFFSSLVFFSLLPALVPAMPLLAGEEEVMRCALFHYERGEYYHAVTETMRYDFLYPRGNFLPDSLLLAGKAFYKGGNYSRAVDLFDDCALRFGDTPQGEEALFTGSMARLHRGSPLFAMSGFSRYMDRYGRSAFTEKASFYRCYGAALLEDYDGALRWIGEYRDTYPEGGYLDRAALLEADIREEINRPMKSSLVAAGGSMLLPGFGHFYTGNYRNGFLSLVTNAVFIALITHGVMTGNTFQWMFFGFIELNFYQYSIVGALRDVYIYNSRDDFHRRLRMQVSVEF